MWKFVLGFILLYSFLFSELLSSTNKDDLADRKKKRINMMHERRRASNEKLPNRFQKNIPQHSEYFTDPDFADLKKDTIGQLFTKPKHSPSQRQQIQKRTAGIPTISTPMTVGFVDSLSPEWKVNYGSYGITHTHVIQAMAIDSFGNVYITGNMDNVSEIMTIKYNKDGEKIWQNKFLDGEAKNVAVDKYGKNIYVLGFGYYDEEDKLVLIKYDSTGTQTWVRYEGNLSFNYPGPDEGIPCDLKLDFNGNIYILSQGYNDDVTNDSYLILKYNPDGIKEWRRSYGSPDQDHYPRAFEVDKNGDVYVTGCSEFEGTYIDIVTVKYSTSGSLIWTKIYKGKFEAEDLPYDIAVDASGFVYVVGNTFAREEDMDYILLKYSSNGTLRWKRIYNTGEHDEDPAFIGVDGSNRIYLTSSFGTIRYTSSGSLQWIDADGYPIGTDGVGLNFDKMDNVYIISKYRNEHSINIFTPDGDWFESFNGFAVNIDNNRNLYIASRVGDWLQDAGVYKVDSLFGFL